MIPNLSYTPQKNTPTVIPKKLFLANEDATILKKAMQGPGTNEKIIINILTKRSLAQRLQIISQYKNLHNRDLIEDLKSELSGNFRNVVVALMTPVSHFYAKELHAARLGLGTDEENILIEVLCTLTNSEIVAVKQAYQQNYKKSLEEDLIGDTSGYFEALLLSLCKAQRNEAMAMFTHPEMAKFDAESLYNASEDRLGADELTFYQILCSKSYAQLKLTFREYESLAGHSLAEAIEKEFSGVIKDGLSAIVDCVNNKAAFFARRFYTSMKGLETSDRDLVRLVVTRCETDMGDIKREYEALYEESLADAIRGKCSGDYGKCLLALIGETDK